MCVCVFVYIYKKSERERTILQRTKCTGTILLIKLYTVQNLPVFFSNILFLFGILNQIPY